MVRQRHWVLTVNPVYIDQHLTAFFGIISGRGLLVDATRNGNIGGDNRTLEDRSLSSSRTLMESLSESAIASTSWESCTEHRNVKPVR